jgi:hypothetical protein
MDDKQRLAQLQQLFGMPEVKAGFASKQAGLSWANQVAPLLNFNSQYHGTFIHYLQIITLNVSNQTAAPAFQNMLNQVEMAIGELKHKIAASLAAEAAYITTSSQPAPKILKLEPNIYGIGINLPALWQRTRAWFRKDKS